MCCWNFTYFTDDVISRLPNLSLSAHVKWNENRQQLVHVARPCTCRVCLAMKLMPQWNKIKCSNKYKVIKQNVCCSIQFLFYFIRADGLTAKPGPLKAPLRDCRLQLLIRSRVTYKFGSCVNSPSVHCNVNVMIDTCNLSVTLAASSGIATAWCLSVCLSVPSAMHVGELSNLYLA